jgi:ribA/ribD-fused uncharacterized protein
MKKPYSLEHLIAQINIGFAPKYMFFWGHRSNAEQVNKSCLSQWYEAPFVLEGITYKTAEHYMMAQKALLFKDEECFLQIINADDPSKAKALGRSVANFNDAVWSQACFEIVVNANIGKFTQNAYLGDFLRATQNRILVEASPVDRIWGIGLASDHEYAQIPSQWKGANYLGFALMEVRDFLLR